MGHVADGVLRRYLDEPGSMGDADREHLSGCTRCEATVHEADTDRRAVLGTLDDPPADGPVVGPDLDAGWARLAGRVDDVTAPRVIPLDTARSATAPRSRRYQVTAGVTAALIVLGGTAAAAAADWLPLFHTESVAPVSVSMADVSSLSSLAGLADLERYGDLVIPSSVEPALVPDAAQAAARTGLDVPQVAALPAGVEGTPQYYVAGQQSATFTFSAAKAARAAAAGGLPLPPVPDGLDGSTLKIDAGPAVAQVWSQASGPPTLVVARLNPPTASGQGASLAEIRDYLLSVPGIPADLAGQLRTVTGDGKTLPIPVLKGQMDSSQADVGGSSATVLQVKGGFGAGAVWISGGRLTVVAGLLDRDEILAVARGLR